MSPQTETTKLGETFLVIMPTLNEEEHIEHTIKSWVPLMKNFPGSEILVIEGGSQDGTNDQLGKLSRKYKFLDVIDQNDKGHGNALMQGYKKAVSTDHHWVFQTDADGHFVASDFYKLWEKKGSSHFVLGHRYKRKDPFYRNGLSRLVSLWILILFGENIKDPNVPFRLVRKSYLKKVIDKVPDGVFAPNIFLSILAKKDDHDLHHVPLKHSPRRDGKRNHLKLLKGAFKGFFELILFSLFVIK